MSTGRIPFQGETSAAIFDAILHETPAAPVRFNSELPTYLEEIISKALEKDRELRYQHAADLRTDLQRLKRDLTPATATKALRLDGADARPSAGSDASRSGAPSYSSRAVSGSSSVVAVAREHKFGAAAATVAVLLLAGAASYGIYAYFHRAAALPFQNFTTTKATNSGDSGDVAISPDGKFLLGVQNTNGQASLRLKNIASGSNTEVVAASGRDIASPGFSPDGNYIYFRESVSGTPDNYDLYRSPIFGGTPELIARKVDSNATPSPDGKYIGYARANDPEVGKRRLLEARAEGGGEKELAVLPLTDSPLNLAWSPDGKRIALSFFGIPEKSVSNIEMFDLAAGQLESFAKFDDKLPFEIAWSPDGKFLYAIYAGLRQLQTSGYQIGAFSYPDGKFRALTHEAIGHESVSVSADGSTIATIQSQMDWQISLSPGAGGESATRLPGIPREQTILGFEWTPDDELLVSEPRKRLFTIRPDGTGDTTVLNEPETYIKDVTSCGAGDSIILVWGLHQGEGWRVWKVRADGSDPMPLTKDSTNIDLWFCSRDGKYAYYSDYGLRNNMMRVASGGGNATVVPGSEISGGVIKGAALSPDGKTAAVFLHTSSPEQKILSNRILLLDLERGEAVRTIQVDPKLDIPFHNDIGPVYARGFQFTPDGKAVAFVREVKGVDNVWSLPLDGSAAKQVTRFDSDNILNFAWSRDGKWLGTLRMNSSSDIVLLRDAGAQAR